MIFSFQAGQGHTGRPQADAAVDLCQTREVYPEIHCAVVTSMFNVMKFVTEPSRVNTNLIRYTMYLENVMIKVQFIHTWELQNTWKAANRNGINTLTQINRTSML